MSLFADIQEAVAAIREVTDLRPRVGLVLGSGLGAFAEQIENRVAIPYGEIPSFPESRVAGHAGQLVMGTMQGVPCAIMSGRVHFYEGHALPRVTFPVRVLAALGVQTLIVTNAAGSVNPTFAPGDVMVIVDHLNLTGDNPLRGRNDDRLGPRFPDMSEAYHLAGRKALHDAAREAQITLREGVYAGLLGPSYETPAEIRMLQRLGADAVGMSTVAEVIAAVHAGLKVAGLSVITNRAAGLSSTPLSHDEVKEIGQKVEGLLGRLLRGAIARLG
ncbi:MAG: purine-nucleoside phosphorylase [Myxococcota bacterium]